MTDTESALAAIDNRNRHVKSLLVKRAALKAELKTLADQIETAQAAVQRQIADAVRAGLVAPGTAYRRRTAAGEFVCVVEPTDNGKGYFLRVYPVHGG